MARRAAFLERVRGRAGADPGAGGPGPGRGPGRDHLAPTLSPPGRSHRWAGWPGWAVGLCRPGGTVLAIKGAGAAAEVSRDGPALRLLGVTDLAVLEVGGEDIDPPATVVRFRAPARRSPAARGSGAPGPARAGAVPLAGHRPEPVAAGAVPARPGRRRAHGPGRVARSPGGAVRGPGRRAAAGAGAAASRRHGSHREISRVRVAARTHLDIPGDSQIARGSCVGVRMGGRRPMMETMARPGGRPGRRAG